MINITTPNCLTTQSGIDFQHSFLYNESSIRRNKIQAFQRKGDILEQSKSFDAISRPQEKRWFVESFASRAALLGFIYLCVNIIYQQGYLSRLGFEFGLFSIARTTPLLFDNFLIAAYSLIAWGFLTEVTPSTYDQLFGFFNPISWRDRNVAKFRIVALVWIIVFYLFLHTLYLIRNNEIALAPVTWPNFISSIRSFNLIDFWAFLIKLAIPTWNFIFWWTSFLSVLGLLLMFRFPNNKYRKVRSIGLYQLLEENRRFMFLQINLITPAFSILAAFFFLVMFPGFIGSETAYLTIKNIHKGGYQQIDQIELTNATMFCSERVNFVGDIAVWNSSSKDNFTVHFLGSISGYDLFVKVDDQQARSGSVSLVPNERVNYLSCLISSGTAKSIIYKKNTFP